MWINRIAAALALVSAVLHLRMGVTDITSAVVAAMALLCIYCALDLLRSPGDRAWVMVAATSAGMILAHSSFPAHHHPIGQASSMTAASAVAAVELILAAAVVFFRASASTAAHQCLKLIDLSDTGGYTVNSRLPFPRHL